MAHEYTAHTSLIVGGLERTVCVVFEVEAWGSDGGFGEPAEGPSIVINDVRNDDVSGRSIYDLCEQCRDIWAKPRYADGVWYLRHGQSRVYGGYSEKAWCEVMFNSRYGLFHSLLDTLYSDVLDNHMPDYEPSDDDIMGSVYHPDTRGEYDV